MMITNANLTIDEQKILLQQSKSATRASLLNMSPSDISVLLISIDVHIQNWILENILDPSHDAKTSFLLSKFYADKSNKN